MVREAFIQSFRKHWVQREVILHSWLGFAHFSYPPRVSGANLLMPSGSHGPCPASASAQSDLTTSYTVDKEAVRTRGCRLWRVSSEGGGRPFSCYLAFALMLVNTFNPAAEVCAGPVGCHAHSLSIEG